MQVQIKIPSGANELIHTLQAHGYSAYAVGGCVRDSILGKKPHDWDICTSASPNAMLSVFQNRRLIETGLKHGTVTVIANHEAYEITTYRIDGAYTDHRRPDNVSFTDDLREDLLRRDFTMNAMAYNDEEGLIDLYDGIGSIKRKEIVCVGNAAERFNEDALRILRAIRFAAQLGFSIAPDTSEAIHSLAPLLKKISVERITSEFCKTLTSDYACPLLSAYQDVFALFLPEWALLAHCPQSDPYPFCNVLEHTIHALECCDSKDLKVRLSVFFHDIGKPASITQDAGKVPRFANHGKLGAEMTANILRRLRFDTETITQVKALIFWHDSPIPENSKQIKRMLNRLGYEQLMRLFSVMRANILAQNPLHASRRLLQLDSAKQLANDVLAANACFSLKTLAVNGKDLIEAGWKPGKQLGEILNQLLEAVIEETIPNKKEALLAFAQTLARNE